jgi:hypothetical protein
VIATLWPPRPPSAQARRCVSAKFFGRFLPALPEREARFTFGVERETSFTLA